jgi:hypothetical protein
MVAPLLDYMPGVRKGIVFDLPRKPLAFSAHRALAAKLRPEGYGDVLIMPRPGVDARTGAGGHPGPHRISRRNAVRRDQRCAPGRKQCCRGPIGRIRSSWCLMRGVALARADGADRYPAGGGGCATCRRTIETMAGGGLCRARQGDGRARLFGLGDRRSAGEGARRGDRSRCAVALPRSDRARPAQCDPGARCGRRGDFQRFRPAPRGGRHRHALDRDFRPDQPVALGPAQSARRWVEPKTDVPCRPCQSGPAGRAIIAACATSRPRRSLRRRRRPLRRVRPPELLRAAPEATRWA